MVRPIRKSIYGTFGKRLEIEGSPVVERVEGRMERGTNIAHRKPTGSPLVFNTWKEDKTRETPHSSIKKHKHTPNQKETTYPPVKHHQQSTISCAATHSKDSYPPPEQNATPISVSHIHQPSSNKPRHTKLGSSPRKRLSL